MKDLRARLATTIAEPVDKRLRSLSAEKNTRLSVATSTLLEYALDHLDDDALQAKLDSAIAEHRDLRADIGRKSMTARWTKENA